MHVPVEEAAEHTEICGWQDAGVTGITAEQARLQIVHEDNTPLQLRLPSLWMTA